MNPRRILLYVNTDCGYHWMLQGPSQH